jgi:hypothetical protein
MVIFVIRSARTKLFFLNTFTYKLLKVNMARQQALQAQLSKNEPELKRYADKLAFTMVGLKGNFN